MTSRSRSKLILVAVTASLLTFCGGGGSGPSDDEVADFIIGLTASDGSVAAQRAGAPPAPNGGPDLTVTSSGSVTSGGNDIVRLRAASPFSRVYADVSGTTGHYELALAAPTTDITVTASLASAIPDNTYLAGYRAASPGGLVGTPVTVTNTVQPTATVTSIAVSGTAALTALGQTSQLTATATLSDGTTQNVTSTATWQSSSAAVATVSSGGLVTAVAAGTATITATTQGKSGTLTITVTVSTLPLTGVWNIGHTYTSQTGTCAGAGSEPLNTFLSDGQTTVGTSGSFTYGNSNSLPGTMNLSSGAWSFSGSSANCVGTDTGQLSASGTCSSSTACSGTFSQTSNPSGGTGSGTITWSR